MRIPIARPGIPHDFRESLRDENNYEIFFFREFFRNLYYLLGNKSLMASYCTVPALFIIIVIYFHFSRSVFLDD